MNSVLRPETKAVLSTVGKGLAPFFSNMIAAELFDAEHSRGPFKVLPHAGGGYVVWDTRAPNNEGSRGHFHTIGEAHYALEQCAKESP